MGEEASVVGEVSAEAGVEGGGGEAVETLTSGRETGLARTQGKHIVLFLLFTWHSCWFYFKLR